MSGFKTEAKDKFPIRHAVVSLSMVCNLRCRLCASRSPYYVNPVPNTVDELNEALGRFFKIVSCVDLLTLSGGEPLLYPFFPELFSMLRQYQKQIFQLEIITNGTLVPQEGFVEQLCCWPGKVKILIDDYGKSLSGKVTQIDDALNKAMITHLVRNNTNIDPHCGGWVDFGDPRQRRWNAIAEAEAIHAKCVYPQKLNFCFTIKGGCVYPCPQVRACKELGNTSRYEDYIDLFDDTLTVTDQRKKIEAIYAAKSFAACAYCNGMCDDSERFIPAEQLTAEELRAIRAEKRRIRK